MMRDIHWTRLALGVLVGLACTAAGAAGAPPTPQDRDAIQGMINRGKPLREQFVKDRQSFIESFDQWDKSGAESDRQAAIGKRDSMRASREKVKANRDSVIAKVDSTFDTKEPPGTDVQYDPDCTDYGYTSERCFVRICEPSFGSPDDVATTKIHEFEHVRQKKAGRWGPGVGTPQPCTYEFHSLEFDAYEAEMDADFGKRTNLGLDTKLEILRRKLEHLNGMLEALGVRLNGDAKILRELPGGAVEATVTLSNESDLAQVVSGHFTDQQGWPVLPPMFNCDLASEHDTTFAVLVQVPPGAPFGGNEILCEAMSGSGDAARDFLFVHVIPVAELQAGPNVSGRPGQLVPWQFTVKNEGPLGDQFDVEVSSVLGWTLTEHHWTVPLAPGASSVLQANLAIPSGPAHRTDLLFARAMSIGTPGHADTAWVYAEIEASSAGVGGDDLTALVLLPGAPNPFARGTVLRFVLPAGGPVELEVFDVAGRRVKTLLGAGSATLPAGIHTVRWDGTDDDGGRIADGVYFAKLRAGARDAVVKMVILH